MLCASGITVRMKIILLFKISCCDLSGFAGTVQCWQHLLLQCSVAVFGADAISSASASGNE
jgi:hypothetical protein